MGDKVAFGTNVEPEVLEGIRALAKAEGIGQGELLERMLTAYSAEPVFKDEESELEAIPVSVPRSRDELAQAFIVLIEAAKPFIGVNWQLSALGVVRSYIYRGTVEYKDAARTRKSPSVYEEEKYQVAGVLPG